MSWVVISNPLETVKFCDSYNYQLCSSSDSQTTISSPISQEFNLQKDVRPVPKLDNKNTDNSSSYRLNICGFRQLNGEKGFSEIEIVSQQEQYVNKSQTGKKYLQKKYQQISEKDSMDISNVKFNISQSDLQIIKNHKKNLFPYFSNHFFHSLKYDIKYQKQLREVCTVTNPVHYVIEKLTNCKLSTKKSIIKLINERDYNINQALYLWFSKYLVPLMSITKESKNKKISQTHKLRYQAFIMSAQDIIEYINIKM